MFTFGSVFLAAQTRSRMPIPTFTDVEMAVELAKFDGQLAYIMDSAKVDPNIQAHLAKNNIKSLSRFANLGDDPSEVKKVLKDDLALAATDGLAVRLAISDVIDAWTNARALVSKKAEVVAEARVNETPLIVQKADHKLMLQAYVKKWGKVPDCEVPGRYFLGTKIEEVIDNDPKVELLTEVACKQEHESDTWTPVFGEDGRVRTRKGTLIKVPAPRDGDELRIKHRLICNAWMMSHLNHQNRPWLAQVTPKTWSDFTDYILGEECNRYQADLPGGRKSPWPNWETVMHYEYQLRKAAYKLVAAGTPMDVALEAVTKCGNIRQMHFTTPCQIVITQGAASSGGKGNQWGNPSPWNGPWVDPADKIKNAFLKPQKAIGNGKGKDKGGKKGDKKGDKGSKGKGRRKLCYAFNNGNECDGNCGFLHACQNCGGEHPKIGCKKKKGQLQITQG